MGMRAFLSLRTESVNSGSSASELPTLTASRSKSSTNSHTLVTARESGYSVTTARAVTPSTLRYLPRQEDLVPAHRDPSELSL